MQGRIWLIGGTRESAEIARVLAAHQVPCIVTVTTAAAQNLYPQTPLLQVRVGALAQIEEFLGQEQIVALLDASHPFAVAISTSASAAAHRHNLPYLRYERPSLTESEEAPSSKGGVSLTLPTAGITVDSLAHLLAGNYLLGHRVLLTIGYKALALFQPWQKLACLYARLLPTVTALQAAVEAGFTPDRLIALRPPISAELEQALWRQWEISLVVTKASGAVGGEETKRTVAAQLGIPLITIARPKIVYPQQTDDLSEVLSFCLAVYSKKKLGKER